GAPINAVAAVSNSDVWVVGDNDMISHHSLDSGKLSWTVSPVPPLGANFTTLQMLGDGEEGWAGGYIPAASPNAQAQLVMLHYKSGTWRRDLSSTGNGKINNLH